MASNTEAAANVNAFVEMLGDTLKTKDGTVKTAEALKDKYVALYFSAHWCPPCRGFTPKLSEWYSKSGCGILRIPVATYIRIQGMTSIYFYK